MTNEVTTRDNAQNSQVVLTVCPSGEHGGGEVLAGAWYRDGGAKCGCGAALVPIEQAPESAAAAVEAVKAAHAAQVAHPDADDSAPETVTDGPAETIEETDAKTHTYIGGREAPEKPTPVVTDG